MTAKTPPKGHASKHVHKQKKHSKAKGKHHQTHVSNPVPSFRPVPPHVAGKPATHPKPRGFAVGDLLPVCSLEAVAMWLRLQGEHISADDVADLWKQHGELSVPAAAREFGLTAAAVRLGRKRLASWEFLILGVDVPGPHAVLATAYGWWSWGELHDPWPCRIEEAWAVSWS